MVTPELEYRPAGRVRLQRALERRQTRVIYRGQARDDSGRVAHLREPRVRCALARRRSGVRGCGTARLPFARGFSGAEARDPAYRFGEVWAAGRLPVRA